MEKRDNIWGTRIIGMGLELVRPALQGERP